MMNRSFSAIALSACLVALTAVSANAGVVVTGNLVPLSDAWGAPDTAMDGAGWSRYQVNVETDDGALISAVDVAITGALHQRWGPDNDFNGSPDPTPQGPAANGRGDSHLTPVGGALVGAAPTENNFSHPSIMSPLPNAGAFEYGVGTEMTGAWGIPGSSQAQTATIAYVVIPDTTPGLLSYEIATSNGTFSGTALIGVPEPATIGLLLTGVVGLIALGRRNG